MRRALPCLAWTVLLLAAAAAGWARESGGPLEQANAALQAGEADKALALLGSVSGPSAIQAQAANLECRVRFTLRQWDAAVKACNHAVDLDGQNSGYHMWLGRALGEKAGRASFLSAYSLGKQVRTEFEAAVHLNPRNAEALSDLGEFYTEAPGVVGGGLDKAESVAKELDRIEPARAHALRARIAGARKDYGTAERELKQAIATSAHPALQWTTLASFYRRHQRWNDLDEAIRNCNSAAAHDRHATVALYDGAGVLIQARRTPELAAQMLENYLASPFKTEEGPAFEAYLRLAALRRQLGDNAAAQKDQAAAHALARTYRPVPDAH